MILANIFSGEFWSDFFYEILWNCMSGLLQIIDSIQKAFFFLVGAEEITIRLADGTTANVTLVDAIFGLSFDSFRNFNMDFNQPIHKAFFATLILFCIILVFSMVCSVIKINMNRQDKEIMPSTSKMLWKSFLSVFIVFLIPFIFCALLAMCGMIFGYFVYILNGSMGGNGKSVADCILRANNNSSKYSEILIDSDKFGRLSVEMSFADLKDVVGIENLKWPMLLISECCVLIGLGMCTLTVSERLINIVLLYLISPIIIATIPLDDGKRWENWKDITTAKITTAGGNIISLYAFLYIINVFGNSILGANVVGVSKDLLNVIYLFIVIGGAFVCAKGGTLMASIISANQGQQEGMSFMASMGMAKMGLRLAGGVAGAAFTATGTKKLALMIHDK